MRNVYFWLVMIQLPLGNDVGSRVYPPAVYYGGVALTISILMLFTYINNLWLMPKYVRSKQYLRYAMAAAVLVALTAVVFLQLVGAYVARYPNISIHHISVFSTPVGPVSGWVDWLYQFYWCAGGLLVWLFVMSTAWYMNDYTRQQQQLEEAQQKQTEAELSFLKSQVNPHFLFNTLNNLYGLALKKADTAPDAILRLSSILRYMLYESNSERVSFEKEKEIMQAYISLEMLRLPADTQCHIDIDSDSDYRVPPLLWMPVLENVFKHGTRLIADNAPIYFSVQIRNHVLTMQSKNSYKAGDTNDSGGIGLTNLRKRLELLYPKRHTITAAAEGDRYVVTIHIQL